MPTKYLHRIVDIKAFDHDDWLNDTSTTVTDAMVAIFFYTHGQPCLEDGQSINILDFFAPCDRTLTTKIHVPNGDEMTISRYDDTETLRPRDGPTSTRTRAKVTFSTTRKIGKITEPIVMATLLSDSSMDCNTPRTASRADVSPTYFSNEIRPTGKTVAAEMLRCLQELEKAGFPERESSQETTADEVEFWRQKRAEAEEKEAKEKEAKEKEAKEKEAKEKEAKEKKAKEKSRKRKNTTSEKKAGKDKKRRATKGKSAEESETEDSDADASNKEESAEVGPKTQAVDNAFLPDTVANDTVVDDPDEYA